MSQKSTISYILFGGITLSSIIGLLFYFWRNYRTPLLKNRVVNKITTPTKTLKNDVPTTNSNEEDDDADDDDENGDTDAKIKDSINEETIEQKAIEKEKELRAQQLKTDYDTAVRLARKLLDGQSYDKAAAKYSEALELANQIPSASKDILTLYQNRSATYEKSSQYEKALNDITVVLAMDPKHIKARSRRARVLDAQGKHRESLFEYIHVTVLEQLSGQQPTNMAKIEEINKVVSHAEAMKIVEKMRKSYERPLPPKSYCRTFFETLPSIHYWKQEYLNGDVESLTLELNKSLENMTNPASVLVHGLKLVFFFLANGLFARALDQELQRISSIVESNQLQEYLATVEPSTAQTMYKNLSIYWELKGTNYHLRCILSKAIESYKKALDFDPGNFEAILKLASVHLELGETDNASLIYADALKQVEGKDDEDSLICKAWILTHRSVLWISKNKDGLFIEGALMKSQEDVDLALSITARCVGNKAGKAARVAALLKSMNLRGQVKAQVGEQVTEEDGAYSKKCMIEAKKLDPLNESLLLAEADTVCAEGDYDRALELTADIQRRNVDSDDGIPNVIRANIYVQRAFAQMQENPMTPQLAAGTMEEAKKCYEEALRLDPMCIEALTQYAQLKLFFSDAAGAVALSEKAIKYGRSKDEVLEICQLNNMALGQLAAFEELRATH